MKTEEIRKLLNVPDGIRIGQHIYNCNRDLEIRDTYLGAGVDIFGISDKRFIKKLTNENK